MTPVDCESISDGFDPRTSHRSTLKAAFLWKALVGRCCMRRCTRCPFKGPDADFGVKIRSKHNDTGVCKACKAQYNKDWYARNKITHRSNVRKNARTYQVRARELVRRYKDVPCHDCNVRYPPYVMQFDHLDARTKRGTISRMVQSGTSEPTLLAEIAKCEVVCANCHAERTHQRRKRPRSLVDKALVS